MKARRTIAIAAVAACALVALPAALPASANPCGGATEIKDMTITATIPKQRYRMGSTVKVSITVVRPGPNDPVTGQSMTSPTYLAAEGVDVGATFYTSDDDLPVFDSGVTDAEGRATLSIKLTRGDPTRYVYAAVGAQSWINQGGCPDIVETGYASYERFFKLVR